MGDMGMSQETCPVMTYGGRRIEGKTAEKELLIEKFYGRGTETKIIGKIGRLNDVPAEASQSLNPTISDR